MQPEIFVTFLIKFPSNKCKHNKGWVDVKLYMLLFTKGGRGRVDKKEEIRIVKKAIKGKPDAYGQLISDFDSFDRVNAKGKAIL